MPGIVEARSVRLATDIPADDFSPDQITGNVIFCHKSTRSPSCAIQDCGSETGTRANDAEDVAVARRICDYLFPGYAIAARSRINPLTGLPDCMP